MNFTCETNKIYYKDESGKLLAEIDFPDCGKNKVNINHTFVDSSLRGQGVAGKLMEAVVEKLKKDGRKAVCTCSYAVAWSQKHREYEDIFE